MNKIHFELGQGNTVCLPADAAVRQIIEQLSASQPPQHEARYHIGESPSGAGGIYVGDILGNNGRTYGLIMATAEDIGRAKWGEEGERTLSDWNGQDNTERLRRDSPAAKLASEYNADGHTDFYLPARRELMIAAANLPHLFGKESYYWTSTPCGSSCAWCVDFENGSVYIYSRYDELRVRPFRRFIY